jgi:hypothetical protein
VSSLSISPAPRRSVTVSTCRENSSALSLCTAANSLPILLICESTWDLNWQQR